MFKEDFIVACHDCSEGGLAICLSEMCIGGGLGCTCNIEKIGKDLRSDMKLFSESNTRWIMEIKKEKIKEFEKALNKYEIPFYPLGKVNENRLIISDGKTDFINQMISELDDIWRHSIARIMG